VFPEIPGFTIIELIGEGAMARVFLAVQNNLNRKVALKVMNQSLAHDPAFRGRFLAEAEDTAKFIHPGIVTIYNTDVYDNNYYLVLEYLEAGTLKDREVARQQHSLEQGGKTNPLFSAQESLVLMAQLADALAYAHSKNIIHRDIKPANIMFRSDGRAVLSDFGIAKSVTENRELTLTGYSVGTPAYMSPEQKLGADIDARSDLYSLGVVFFELLTGRKPYNTRTGNYADLRKEWEAAVPELPSELSHLQPLINKLLAKNPDERYQSAGELLQAIKQQSGSAATLIEDATVFQPGVTRTAGAARGRTLVRRSLLGGLAVVTVGLIGISVLKLRPEPPPEVVPVSEETAEEINGLLGTAELFLDSSGFLINAGPNNAVAIFKRVLELQAGNPRALKGLESAQERIIAEITADIEAGDRQKAQELIELVALYFPDDARLASLREKARG
jgi:serine/threonine-protein kinase PpkA